MACTVQVLPRGETGRPGRNRRTNPRVVEEGRVLFKHRRVAKRNDRLHATMGTSHLPRLPADVHSCCCRTRAVTAGLIGAAACSGRRFARAAARVKVMGEISSLTLAMS